MWYVCAGCFSGRRPLVHNFETCEAAAAATVAAATAVCVLAEYYFFFSL
jgi:hypothetical protein